MHNVSDSYQVLDWLKPPRVCLVKTNKKLQAVFLQLLACFAFSAASRSV